MNFEITKEISGDLILFKVAGKILSHEEVDDMDDMIYTALEDVEGNPKMILDLEGLNHTNSTGLNHFIRYFTKCRNKGGELVMINMTPPVLKLLEITKLIDVFTVAQNVEEAKQILNDL
ncbi:MAG: STAS domain-containing protein [Crocinitomicaceae bacterium]|nr:STAS domain-containing protein [Crocinitomicaceae bacterium]